MMIHQYLMSFALFVNLGILNLTFSETINITTLDDLTLITLQGAPDLTMTAYVMALTGGGVEQSTDGFIAIISLTEDDLNNIKSMTGLATGYSNTFISFPNSTVQDLAGNDVIGISNTTAMNVSLFMEDNVSPELSGFALNMNSGLLTLTFTETVNISSFNASGIVLQNARNRTEVFYQLTDGTNVTVVNLTTLNLYLSNDDLFNLQAMLSLAIDEESTYIAIENITITDSNQNPVEHIPLYDATRATVFVSDTTKPRLDSFNLDMDNLILSLTFSEVVLESSFIPAYITLQNAAMSLNGQSVQLSGGLILNGNSNTINISLSDEDANSIKLQTGLGTNMLDTYIALRNGTFTDAVGNLLQPIPMNMSLMVSSVIRDQTAPQLLNFTFNLNASTLELTFDEIVNASSLVVNQITLQPNDMPPSADSVVALNNSLVVLVDSEVVTVTINPEDISVILLRDDLATNADNTYINISSDSIADFDGNLFEGLAVAMQTSSYIRDSSSPELSSFSVNLNDSTLSLTFNELVNVSALDVTSITLQSSDGMSAHQLTNTSYSDSDNGVVVVVNINSNDFNEIAADRNLYVDLSSSHLTIAPGTILDLAGNEVLFNSLQATNYTEDEIIPVLFNYSLDLNSGIILLTFSETVNLAAIDPSKIGFASNATSPAAVQLSLSTPMRNFSAVAELSLTSSDLNALKANPELAVFPNNTFLILESGAVEDMHGNSIDMSVLEAVNVTADVRSPELQRFTLDLRARNLYLVFDEFISSSSVDITELVLQNRTGVREASHRITSDSDFEIVNYTTIVVALSIDDYNGIIEMPLCSNTDDCFISFISLFATDSSNNRVVAIPEDNARKAVDFSEDDLRPQLINFETFDYNTGNLVLIFSESVNVNSFNFSVVTLRSSFIEPSTRVILSPSNSSSFDSENITITLSNEVLNSIKANTGICRSMITCSLRFSQEFVSDRTGNAIAEVVPTLMYVMSEHPSNLIDDTTPPSLRSFNLNMSSLQMTFSFDEVVNPTTMMASLLTIQSDVDGTENVTFTSLTPDSNMVSNVVTATIGNTDAVAIKARTNLASNRDNTYISIYCRLY